MKRYILILLILVFLLLSSGCDSVNSTAYSLFVSLSDNAPLISELNNVTRFYRSQLTGVDAEDYDTLLMGYSRHEKNILGLKSDLPRISELSQLVTLDYPELFWVTNTGLYYSDSSFWLFFSSGPLYSPNYRYDINEIHECQNAIRVIKNEFIQKNQYLSDYDKALAAYDYIIDNTEYDNDTADLILNNDEYDITKDTSQCITSVFLERKSVCAGYSAAYQFLLGSVGIESAGIIGKINNDSPSFNHEWNILKLDDEYYYTDITWGEMNDSDSVIEYGYFCINSKEMFSTHIVSDNQYFPITTSNDCNYFFRNNRFYENFDLTSINNDLVSAAISQKDCIYFKFSNIKDFNKFVSLMLDENSYELAQSFSDMASANSNLILKNTSFVSNPDIKTIKIILEYKN